MPENQKQKNEGCGQVKVKKGYQPSKPNPIPIQIGDSKPLGGYQPTNSGDGPVIKPAPPSDE